MFGIWKIGDQGGWGDWYYSMRLGMRKSINRRDRDTETGKHYYYFTILNTFERLFRLPATKDFS